MRCRPEADARRSRVSDSVRQDVPKEAWQRGGWKILDERSMGRKSSSTTRPPARPGSTDAKARARTAHCPPVGIRTEGIVESGKAGRPEQSAPEHGTGRSGRPSPRGVASAPARASPSSLASAPPGCERAVRWWDEQPARADAGNKRPSVESARNAPIQGHASRPRIENLIPPRELVDQLCREELFPDVDWSGANRV
jgi:hypothetical protein